MNCHVHPNREAYALCVNCGKPACPECLITLHGQEYCRTCLEAKIAPGAAPEADVPVAPAVPQAPPAPPAAPKALPAAAAQSHSGPEGRNDALTTILALFPGLGHLYLGLRTRGLHLMGGFIAALILTDILQLDRVLYPWLQLVAIFFSVFDAREALSRMRKGLPVHDEPLFNLALFEGKDNQKLLAYGLIAVGALAIIRSVLVEAMQWMVPYGYNSALVERTILAGLLIAGGVYLLRGGFGDRKT